MISALEVGAIYTIEDRASYQLNAIIAATDRLAESAGAAMEALSRVGVGVRGLGSLAARLGRVEDALASVAGAADRMAGGIDGALASVGDAATAATDRVAALRGELAGAATAARGLRGGMGGAGGSGGGGGGGRGGPLHRAGAALFSLPGLAVGLSAYEGFKSALSTDLYEREALMLMGRPTTGAAGNAAAARLHGLIRGSAVGTIYTQQQTAEAYSVGAGVLVQSNDKRGIASYNKLFPTLLRTSEVAAQFGLGSVTSNVAALSGLPHLLGQYDPAKMSAIDDLLLKVAEATHHSLTSVVRASSLALPPLIAAGVNPSEALTYLATGIRGGLQNRAGYALGQMVLGLTDTGGALSGHLVKERAALLHTHGKPSYGGKMSAHTAALHAMGLVNSQGRLTVMDKHGDLNLDAMVSDVVRFAQAHDKQTYLSTLHAGFGVRGMRMMEILVKGQQQVAALEKRLAALPSGAAQQAELANTPMQKLEQVLARLQDTLNDLATRVLPQFTTGVDGLLAVVNRLDAFFSGGGGPKGRVAGFGAGAALGATIGGKLFGPEGAVIGAIIGGEAALMLGAHGKLPPALGLHHPSSLLPGAPLGPGGLVHKQAYLTGGGGVTVHIDNLNVPETAWHGDSAVIQKIAAGLAEAIHSASKTNLGTGLGWDESPYTQGPI